MNRKNIFENPTVIVDGFINGEGNFQHQPQYMTTEHINIDKHYFEEVLKKQLNPKGFNFGLYDGKKEIIKEKIIVDGLEQIIFATSTNEFPKWYDNAVFIRISKLHPAPYFNVNWLKSK